MTIIGSNTYSRAQKILHWLLAVLVLFWLFVSGELVADAEGADKAFLLYFHSGGAILILALTLVRYRLRVANKVAPLAELNGWEKTWSVRLHLTLYLAVIVMASSGILQGIFFEQDVRVFGFINITIGHNETAMEIFHEIHEITATVLKLLIALHVLAGLKHQFIDRKPIFKRMM